MTWAVENFWYRSENRVNPYNQGAVRNFREILCTKIPASKTDFRAKVERETSRQMVGIPSNIDDQDDTGKSLLIYLHWVQGLQRVADLIDTVCHQKG